MAKSAKKKRPPTAAERQEKLLNWVQATAGKQDSLSRYVVSLGEVVATTEKKIMQQLTYIEQQLEYHRQVVDRREASRTAQSKPTILQWWAKAFGR